MKTEESGWQSAAAKAQQAATDAERGRERTLPRAMLTLADRLDLLGMKAWYTPEEEAEVAALVKLRAWSEIVVLHELKARFDARMVDDFRLAEAAA